MGLSTRVRRIAGTIVFAVAVIATQFAGMLPVQAITNTATWTGEAGDISGEYKFSEAGNWEENSVPTDGAELIFSGAAMNLDNEIENDLTDVEFSKVTTISGVFGYFSIVGEPLLLQDGAILEQDDEDDFISVFFESGIKGNGSLELVNWGVFEDTEIDGPLSAENSSGVLGGEYGIRGITDLILSGDSFFIIEGNTSFSIYVNEGASAYFAVYPECPGSECKKITRTISGDVFLGGNLTVYVGENVTTKFTGFAGGTGKVVRDPSSDRSGVLMVNGEKLVNPTKTINVGMKSGYGEASYASIYDNQTGVLSGKAVSLNVYKGGLLKGEGQTEDLYVEEGGIVSPGNSPGTITVTTYAAFAPGSIFQAEILNAKSYDQIKAKTIDLDDAILDLSFLKGGKIYRGDKFTLINNTGNDPIDGKFKGIGEGDKVTLGGAVFRATYKGGSGNNNFVLTALNDAVAPGTPNTGSGSLTSDGLVTIGLAVILASVAIVGAVLQLRPQQNRQ